MQTATLPLVVGARVIIDTPDTNAIATVEAIGPCYLAGPPRYAWTDPKRATRSQNNPGGLLALNVSGTTWLAEQERAGVVFHAATELGDYLPAGKVRVVAMFGDWGDYHTIDTSQVEEVVDEPTYRWHQHQQNKEAEEVCPSGWDYND